MTRVSTSNAQERDAFSRFLRKTILLDLAMQQRGPLPAAERAACARQE
jgi:hypothetical protein